MVAQLPAERLENLCSQGCREAIRSLERQDRFDLTNAFHVAPEELGGLLSSEVVSQAFAGARLVKAFNHLPAKQLGTNPSLPGQRQVVFISSNDADASTSVAAVCYAACLRSSRTRKAR